MTATYLVTTTRRRIVFSGTLHTLADYIGLQGTGWGRLQSVEPIDTVAYVERGAIVPLEG